MPKQSQNENFAVRVTLSPEQARAVVAAIDFYIRIRMGQFTEFGHIFYDRNGRDDRVGARLSQIRALIYPGLSSSEGAAYSISSVPYEDAKIGYDVLQVIRQAEAFGRKPDGPAKNGHIISFDDPHFVSDSVPKPKAEILGPLEMLATSTDEVVKPKRKRR